MKSILQFVVVGAAIIGLSSCQTMEGIGKDISSGGEALSGAASR